VLKTSDLGENDKIAWLFTDKLGKISTLAKGAKKSKSKYFSITLPLCYGEYMVFKGKSLYNISEGKIIESFQELLKDLTTLTYGSYICELIDISMQEEESNRELYKVFVTALYMLKTGAIDNELLLRAFELNLLKLTGYGINFDCCSVCRSKITSASYISLQYYGGVCDSCSKMNGLAVSRAAYSSLRFLNNTPLDKVYRLSLSGEVKEELSKIMSMLIANNYSRKPKSLQMLDFI
jgi:DNA repair protein RecO (recombination protein O)